MRKSFALVALAAGVLFTACQREPIGPEGDGRKEIKITASMETKATATAFEAGDKIGLSIGKPVNESRVLLNVTQSGITPEKTLWWPVDCETTTSADFAAWYPYGFTDTFDPMADVSVTLPVNQYAQGVYQAWDLLGATASATPADESVNLVFGHMFSRIKLTIVDQLTTDSFKDVQTDDFHSIEISGLMRNAVVNVSKNTVTASASDDTKGYPLRASEKVYWLLVAPQKASPEIAVKLNSGKTVLYNSSAPINFRSGKQISATLTLKDQTIDFNCSITDWSDDSSSWTIERQVQPNNEIWYYTTDGEVMMRGKYFGEEQPEDLIWTVEALQKWVDAEIESNTYENGMGIIRCKTDITEIGMNPFQSIGFQEIYNLKAISFPNSVKAVGFRCFLNCENLETVLFPAHLEKLGDGLFSNCGSITELCIPEFDQIYSHNLGQYQLLYCRNLKKITGPYATQDGRCLIKNGVLMAFAPAGISEYSIPSGVKEIRDYTFAYSPSLTSVTLPNTLRVIGKGAFEGTYLESISLPESLEYIGDEAFNSSYFTSVYIPSGAELGKDVFNGNYLKEFTGKYASADGRFLEKDNVIIAFAFNGLRVYTIPEGIVGIDCNLGRKLCIFTFPSTLESINAGYSSFITTYSDLTSIVSLATVPPAWSFSSYSKLEYLEDFKAIYVPATSVDAYKAAEGWSIYADFIKPLPVASEAVDLGLPSGTRWASCNMGATSPEENGQAFCWGDITPQEGYWGYGNYRYMDSDGNWTKYFADGGPAELEPEDDAAAYWLGEGWHMPVEDDLDELYENCDVTYEELNGVNGWCFSSKVNENSFFLPVDSEMNHGRYWINYLYGNYGIVFWDLDTSGTNYFLGRPNYTLLIRPVYKEQQ